MKQYCNKETHGSYGKAWGPHRGNVIVGNHEIKWYNQF